MACGMFFKDALHSFSSSVPHTFTHAQILVVQTTRSRSIKKFYERLTTLKLVIIQV